MNELLSNLVGVATLKRESFERLHASKDAMRIGVLILLACFLIAGSSQFAVTLVQGLTGDPVQEMAEIQEQFLEQMRQSLQFMPPDAATEEMLEQIRLNTELGFNIGAQISSLDTPLPRGLSVFLQALGQWISNPLAHLGAWLAYAIWVLLFAKLLGGFGGIDRFLGLTALYAVPRVLGFFSPIPYVGWLIALVGTIWGIVIYVRAVEVSQRFDTGKAILATVLPALIVFIVIALVTGLGVVGLISAIAGAQ
jgi:hypothetical protein